MIEERFSDPYFFFVFSDSFLGPLVGLTCVGSPVGQKRGLLGLFFMVVVLLIWDATSPFFRGGPPEFDSLALPGCHAESLDEFWSSFGLLLSLLVSSPEICELKCTLFL